MAEEGGCRCLMSSRFLVYSWLWLSLGCLRLAGKGFVGDF